MPWRGLNLSYSVTPNSSQFLLRASSCCWAIGSVMGSDRSHVGVLWSAVATVRSVRRTLRPAMRSPSNAWGDVTSCTRCRSTYRIVGCPASSCTTWLSHIFSNIVFGGILALLLR